MKRCKIHALKLLLLSLIIIKAKTCILLHLNAADFENKIRTRTLEPKCTLYYILFFCNVSLYFSPEKAHLILCITYTIEKIYTIQFQKMEHSLFCVAFRTILFNKNIKPFTSSNLRFIRSLTDEFGPNSSFYQRNQTRISTSLQRKSRNVRGATPFSDECLQNELFSQLLAFIGCCRMKASPCRI